MTEEQRAQLQALRERVRVMRVRLDRRTQVLGIQLEDIQESREGMERAFGRVVVAMSKGESPDGAIDELEAWLDGCAVVVLP